MTIEITLIDFARDPLQKLYGAYRTCYTPKTPGEVWTEMMDDSLLDSGSKINPRLQSFPKTTLL